MIDDARERAAHPRGRRRRPRARRAQPLLRALVAPRRALRVFEHLQHGHPCRGLRRRVHLLGRLPVVRERRGRSLHEGGDRDRARNAGTVYSTVGSSSRADGFYLLDHLAMVISLREIGAMVIDVKSGRLDATWIQRGGTIVDTFTILKGGDDGSDSDSDHDSDHDSDRDSEHDSDRDFVPNPRAHCFDQRACRVGRHDGGKFFERGRDLHSRPCRDGNLASEGWGDGGRRKRRYATEGVRSQIVIFKSSRRRGVMQYPAAE